MNELYEVLNLKPGASKEEVDQAFAQQMRIFYNREYEGTKEHAREKFDKVVESYSVLTGKKQISPYQILNATKDQTDAEIRRAYQEQIKKYRDLGSKGMSLDQKAEYQKVLSAYQMIIKERKSEQEKSNGKKDNNSGNISLNSQVIAEQEVVKQPITVEEPKTKEILENGVNIPNGIHITQEELERAMQTLKEKYEQRKERIKRNQATQPSIDAQKYIAEYTKNIKINPNLDYQKDIAVEKSIYQLEERKTQKVIARKPTKLGKSLKVLGYAAAAVVYLASNTLGAIKKVAEAYPEKSALNNSSSRETDSKTFADKIEASLERNDSSIVSLSNSDLKDMLGEGEPTIAVSNVLKFNEPVHYSNHIFGKKNQKIGDLWSPIEEVYTVSGLAIVDDNKNIIGATTKDGGNAKELAKRYKVDLTNEKYKVMMYINFGEVAGMENAIGCMEQDSKSYKVVKENYKEFGRKGRSV